MLCYRVVDVTTIAAVNHQKPRLPRTRAFQAFPAGYMFNAFDLAIRTFWFRWLSGGRVSWRFCQAIRLGRLAFCFRHFFLLRVDSGPLGRGGKLSALPFVLFRLPELIHFQGRGLYRRLADDSRRNTGNRRMWWHIAQYHTACTHLGTIADPDIAQDFGTG